MDLSEGTSQTISLCIACSPPPRLPIHISEGRAELLTRFTYINSYFRRAQFTALYDYLVICVYPVLLLLLHLLPSSCLQHLQ